MARFRTFLFEAGGLHTSKTHESVNSYKTMAPGVSHSSGNPYSGYSNSPKLSSKHWYHFMAPAASDPERQTSTETMYSSFFWEL